jgi:TRL (tRNA-associated locus)-like protein
MKEGKMYGPRARTFAASAVVLGALAVGACASDRPVGFLYYGASIPEGGTSEVAATKSGEATCTSVFGLVATGDCSIQAAKSQGGVKRVAYVDRKVDNILGFGRFTTIVYGD